MAEPLRNREMSIFAVEPKLLVGMALARLARRLIASPINAAFLFAALYRIVGPPDRMARVLRQIVVAHIEFPCLRGNPLSRWPVEPAVRGHLKSRSPCRMQKSNPYGHQLVGHVWLLQSGTSRCRMKYLRFWLSWNHASGRVSIRRRSALDGALRLAWGRTLLDCRRGRPHGRSYGSYAGSHALRA